MNYGRPELGERLAADYVLGMMPARARGRFERAMASNATLTAAVAACSERLTPLDSLSADELPPERVWRAIERRIMAASPGTTRMRTRSFVFWRRFAAIGVAACAAVALYVALNPAPSLKIADAISHWTSSAKHSPADLGLSTISLGVHERERPRWLRAALLVTDDALPMTAEPPPRQH
jgi:hypothetical protein